MWSLRDTSADPIRASPLPYLPAQPFVLLSLPLSRYSLADTSLIFSDYRSNFQSRLGTFSMVYTSSKPSQRHVITWFRDKLSTNLALSKMLLLEELLVLRAVRGKTSGWWNGA